MILKQDSDVPELNGFIDDLFGKKSLFTKNEFMGEIKKKKCSWIFNPSKIRMRYFQWAGHNELLNEFEHE